MVRLHVEVELRDVLVRVGRLGELVPDVWNRIAVLVLEDGQDAIHVRGRHARRLRAARDAETRRGLLAAPVHVAEEERLVLHDPAADAETALLVGEGRYPQAGDAF